METIDGHNSKTGLHEKLKPRHFSWSTRILLQCQILPKYEMVNLNGCIDMTWNDPTFHLYTYTVDRQIYVGRKVTFNFATCHDFDNKLP